MDNLRIQKRMIDHFTQMNQNLSIHHDDDHNYESPNTLKNHSRIQKNANVLRPLSLKDTNESEIDQVAILFNEIKRMKNQVEAKKKRKGTTLSSNREPYFLRPGVYMKPTPDSHYSDETKVIDHHVFKENDHHQSDGGKINMALGMKDGHCLNFSKIEKSQWVKVLPSEPLRPSPSDCCGNACPEPFCVFDIYRQDLEDFHRKCKIVECEYEKRVQSGNLELYNRKEQNLADNSGFPEFILEEEDSYGLNLREDIGSEQLETSGLLDFVVTSEYRTFIIQSIRVSESTQLKKTLQFNLSLPGKHPERLLNVDHNHHVILRDVIHGEYAYRAYTPTSHPYQFTSFELTIKVCGKMSEFLLENKKVGDLLHLRGPIPNEYSFCSGEVDEYLFLAAGSGITPIYQYLLHIEAKQPIYPTSATLFYTCSCLQDIWKLKELMEITLRSYGKINVYFWISRQHKKDMNALYQDERLREWLSQDKSGQEDYVILDKFIFTGRRLNIEDVQTRFTDQVHPHQSPETGLSTENSITSRKALLCGPTDFSNYMKKELESLRKFDSVHIL